MGFVSDAVDNVRDKPGQYLKTFIWGGALIASIQVLVDGGHGVWGAIIAAAPIKDILVVALTPQRNRQLALNDMFLADAAVVIASLGMMVAFHHTPGISIASISAVGIAAWLLASVITMRPPPFGRRGK